MSTAKVCSGVVMPPTIRRLLFFLKAVGGLPVQIQVGGDMDGAQSGGDDGEGPLIRFKTSLRATCWSFALSTSVFLAPSIGVVAIFRAHDITAEQLSAVFTSNGFTRTDFFGLSAFQSLLVATLYVFIVTLSRSPGHQERFAELMDSTRPLNTAQMERVAKPCVRRTAAIFFAFLLPCVGFAMVANNVVGHFDERMTLAWRIAVVTLIGFVYFGILFPLPPCSSVFLISLGLSVCTEVVVNFENYLDTILLTAAQRPDSPSSTSSEEIPSSKTNLQKEITVNCARRPSRISQTALPLEDILSRGTALARLLESAQPAYGRLAFDECAASLLFGIFGSYLGCSTLQSVPAVTDTSLLVWMLLADAAVTVIYFYRFFYCVGLGQRLEESVSRAAAAVRRELLEQRAAELDASTAVRVGALKERLEKFGGIRPRNAFHLNTSMALSSVGTLVTYVIVLLQFKSAESS